MATCIANADTKGDAVVGKVVVERLPAARNRGGTGVERIAKRQRQREMGYIADCGSVLGQQWFVAASGSDGAGAVAIGCERMLLGPTPMQKA